MKHKHSTILLLTLLTFNYHSLSSQEENNNKKGKNSTKEQKLAQAINPLKQGDSLKLADFTEIYPPVNKNGLVETEPILSKITKKGTGAKAIKGETLTVHYTGCLPAQMESTQAMLTRTKIENKQIITVGYKFDSSLDRGQAFQFKLGAGLVIPGWDLILADMKVGEKRIIILPAKQAYGTRATGRIPANATLIFEIELIAAS